MNFLRSAASGVSGGTSEIAEAFEAGDHLGERALEVVEGKEQLGNRVGVEVGGEALDVGLIGGGIVFISGNAHVAAPNTDDDRGGGGVGCEVDEGGGPALGFYGFLGGDDFCEGADDFFFEGQVGDELVADAEELAGGVTGDFPGFGGAGSSCFLTRPRRSTSLRIS